MELRQQLRFQAQSETLVEFCLRGLGAFASLDEERENFLFTNHVSNTNFKVHCAIVLGGIDIVGTGECAEFYSALIEALTAEFGQLSVTNATEA